MQQLTQRFWSDRRGATSIEYGLIVALISVVITSVLQVTGCQINTKFAAVKNALN